VSPDATCEVEDKTILGDIVLVENVFKTIGVLDAPRDELLEGSDVQLGELLREEALGPVLRHLYLIL